MNARATAQSLHARDAALDAYIDALLSPLEAVVPEIEAASIVGEVETPATTTAAVDSGDSNRAVYRLCLVAGVQLAIPLGDIESQCALDAPLRTVPTAPPWCLGIVETQGRHCHVIDLARVVAPALAARAAPGVALTLVGGHWMLACDALGEDIVLANSDVRWRERASDRPWLAGTALERRCAVLDVVGLSGMLSREMQHV